jgi:hypothetical protein
VHAVLETPTFLRDVAESGVSEDQRERIVRRIAENPRQGDVIPGTGGARKVRFAGAAKANRAAIASLHISPRMMFRCCYLP